MPVTTDSILFPDPASHTSNFCACRLSCYVCFSYTESYHMGSFGTGFLRVNVFKMHPWYIACDTALSVSMIIQCGLVRMLLIPPSTDGHLHACLCSYDTQRSCEHCCVSLHVVLSPHIGRGVTLLHHSMHAP